MTEANLAQVTEHLAPHRDRLAQLMDAGTWFLIISTALEIFGQYIELPGGERLETLKLLPFHTKRNMKDRHDSTVLGKFRGQDIMGYDARFTEQYGNEAMPFLKVERGHGFSRTSDLEGIHHNHFIGTNLMGPILVMNPPLIKWIRRELTGDDAIPYENYMQAGYEIRREKILTSKEILNQHKG
jgi:CobQ-like glutamine amidotransferase family enzyme